MESILTSIKKLLGITEEYTHFDADIVLYINTILSFLTQLGIGPATGYSIHDASALWTDYMPEDPLTEPVKTYLFLRVKLLFDPPLSSAVIEAMNRSIEEFEWRLIHQTERSVNNDI